MGHSLGHQKKTEMVERIKNDLSVSSPAHGLLQAFLSADRTFMSQDRVKKLVQMAALVASRPLVPATPPEEKIETEVAGAADFEQGLQQDWPAIQWLLDDYRSKLGAEPDIVAQMFDDIRTPKDLEDVRGMLTDRDAHANGLRVRWGAWN